MNNKRLFYITGRGGNYNAGLGVYLASLPHEFSGVSLSPEFLRLEFEDQLDQIRKQLDILQPSHVIANSYGGYLLLHTLLSMEPRTFKLLLLSPILGKGMSSNRIVRPPRANILKEVFMSGHFPKPDYLEIQIGEHDPSDPMLALLVAKQTKADKCSVIPNQGHTIDAPVVRYIVGEFIS